MVEFSPATREARVRFPANAVLCFLFLPFPGRFPSHTKIQLEESVSAIMPGPQQPKALRISNHTSLLSECVDGRLVLQGGTTSCGTKACMPFTSEGTPTAPLSLGQSPGGSWDAT